MALAAGTKLGPYEIQSLLGAGGMGEVYRARDTRLDRTVAIKILPQGLADTPEVRQRFEREARSVSSLNHPHICALYDVGNQDGIEYLVMEYIEGETLAKRLENGPLANNELLRYAIEVADALDRAHRQGVIHRDLKPGNIMLTKSGAKLLDFGLAKASVPPLAGDFSSSPTVSRPLVGKAQSDALTAQGTIVGTYQYMSPEQLEGGEADERSDIFSFGSVLYEMATAKKAFSAKSTASLIAAILKEQPRPISELQPMAPPALERVVKTCLEKDPDERWQSAGDLKRELTWIASAGSQAGIPAPIASKRKTRDRAIWIAAGALAALAAVYLVWQSGMWQRGASPMHLSVTLPADKVLAVESTGPLAISPDGSTIVFSARGDDRKTQLYARKLGTFESTPIPGTEGAFCPFFSPNGEWLGFASEDFKLKKMSVRGGTSIVLADEVAPTGAMWADDDTIYYAKSFFSGLYAVPAGGGQPKQVTQTGSMSDDRSHLWPNALPGNSGLIFTAWAGKTFNEARIEGMLFKSGKPKVLIEGGSDGRYVPGGYLAYVRNGTLFLVGFDPKTLEVKGTPIPVVEGVRTAAADGGAVLAVSNNGTLVFQPGTFTARGRNLVWMDRSGKSTNITDEVKPYSSPAISPDGKRIALTLEGSSYDVWVYDLERGTLTKVTFGADDYSPKWSPDGRMLMYRSSKSGSMQLYVKHGIVQGDETVVTDGPEFKEAYGWTPDGREIIFGRENKDKGWDLYAASVEGDHKPRPLVVSQYKKGWASLSPDGKWIAYTSDESGQREIFVQAMNDPGTRAQISSEGGTAPRWARSGNELTYLAKDGMMSVKFARGSGLNPGKPVKLFYDKRIWSGYDLSADGRFVVAADADEKGGGNQINVVLHWFDELKQEQQK
ncbi:MAG TPA: protein kinase [Candidatus Binatus sp.]|jgi:Tol biopolymer transport system component/predicted Ser/Thr protein kinase|nr:protein kinase [Candidatus Binatus sp.]